MDSWSNIIKELPKKVKKLSIVKKILLALIFAIFVAGCYWAYVNVQLSQYHSANTKLVDTHLSHIANEEYEKAYSLFSDKYKQEANFETFKQSVLPLKPIYTDYKPNSFELNRTTRFLLPLDLPTLRYIGEISYLNGDRAQVTAIFIWENNAWKLYILEFNSPNSRFDKISEPEPSI